MKSLKVAIVAHIILTVCTILFPTTVLAQQDVCRMAASGQETNIRTRYGSEIDFWLRIASALQAKGINPETFAQAMPDGSVQIMNIPMMVQTLARQRDTGLLAVFQGFQQCESGFSPYQQIINTGVFFVTTGISQILPPAATHVDASNILSGTPFGGQNALIPQARDKALNGLGIGGDVAKVIRDPRCIFGC